jgi:hypothetical protein
MNGALKRIWKETLRLNEVVYTYFRDEWEGNRKNFSQDCRLFETGSTGAQTYSDTATSACPARVRNYNAYRNMNPAHNGSKLNATHSLSHSENCATPWRPGSGFSNMHHWEPSLVTNSQLLFIPTNTGHTVSSLAVYFNQCTESRNKPHDSLDTCSHNDLETPIIFPHRLTEPRNEAGHAVRVRRIKIRRYQHKMLLHC